MKLTEPIKIIIICIAILAGAYLIADGEYIVGLIEFICSIVFMHEVVNQAFYAQVAQQEFRRDFYNSSITL